ncbi:hypothetical protein OA40_15165 [Morganella morganii]|uniref:hypothetical protein n=1 Tax=Morganella morganii TaxID=582 RepID=UPI00062C7EF7|nr:hypothetical protein [Morganella morganii]KKY64767.1 hypothetical protein OA40_15165 [Morganella morganii]
MLTLNKIKNEATMFRERIEKCDKNQTPLVIDRFPIMSCKLSSMLLAYHFLTLWPESEITGISAATGRRQQITHYWLEINNIVIDITGDQYNLIPDNELNKKIIAYRPFPAIHVISSKKSYLYTLFKVQETEKFTAGFPTIGEDFIEEMKFSYNKLMGNTQ